MLFRFTRLALLLFALLPSFLMTSNSQSRPGSQSGAGIVGVGAYVPERVLTNEDLARLIETSDEWIVSRTGIRARRIAAKDEGCVDLAENAARRALQDARMSPDQLDMIIVATCTPDYQFPSTASLLQNRLGAHCGAFDLEAACSGFVYGLANAVGLVKSGLMRTVLVVGSEVMSRVVDWSDRNTAVLFGDGAGAAVISSVPEGRGFEAFDLGSDGSGGELLKIETCALTAQPDGGSGSRRVVQNGREVYKFAVHAMGESASRALQKLGLGGDDVNVFVPHQANIRIIESAAKRISVPMEKVFVNVQKYGNTSAASIPIALAEAREAGRIKEGDRVVTVGFGAGLTWASAVMVW